MRHLLRLSLPMLAALLLGACASGPAHSSRPAWIDNPGDGVSASAGMHIYGRPAQEALAIQRAREEFAKHYGVTVESTQVITTTVANNTSSTVASGTTREETNQQNVRAQVKAKWLDPDTDTLWVWLVPAK